MKKTAKAQRDDDDKPKSINKSFVESTDAPGYYWRPDMPYFYLKITDTGSKFYQVYGKVKGERSPVRITIGRHGEALPDGTDLTTSKAREDAKQIYGLMRAGKNPVRERKAAKRQELAARAEADNREKQRSITLHQVFDAYCKASRLTQNSLDTYGYVVNYCFKDWLDKPLSEINRDKVSARHQAISSGDGFRKPSAAQANLAMKILSAVFNFAINHYEDHADNPVFTSNPVKRWVEKSPRGSAYHKLKPRTDLIEDHQMQAWFRAAGALDHAVARDFFLFLMFTGPRKAEAERLKWRDIDKRKGVITFTDTKNGESYQLPITEQTAAVLESRRAGNKTEYVFPGQNINGHVSDLRNQIEAIEEAARKILVAEAEDVHERERAREFFFTHHSLRRTFTTIAARHLPSYMVAAMTNHKDKSDITQTHYTHISVEDMREPMRKVNDHIMIHAKVDLRQLLKLSASKETVVPLRRKA